MQWKILTRRSYRYWYCESYWFSNCYKKSLTNIAPHSKLTKHVKGPENQYESIGLGKISEREPLKTSTSLTSFREIPSGKNKYRVEYP